MVFPELLAGIFSGNSGKDFLSTWKLLSAGRKGYDTVGIWHTWVLICKGSQVIDILIYNNVKIIWLAMRRNVGC
jgi:hypothetical protein